MTRSMGWRGTRRGVAGGVLGVGLVLSVQGASGQERSLGEPLAVAREPFSLVNTVRELADGRVLVADPLGGVLVRLDAALQGIERLGREGGGPEEYRQPDAVWPLPGDSTLLVDLGNARLTVVGPDGSFGRTRPITLGEPGPGGPPAMALPRGVDAGGRIYFEGPRMVVGGPPPDSVEVLRAGPVGASTEGVVRVKLPGVRTQSSGGGGNVGFRVTPVPLSPVDAWGVAPSGAVAVARSEPYRLEWIRTDGRRVAGPPVSWSPVRIRQAEQEEWELERGRSGGGIGVSMTIENGRTSVSFGRGGAGRPGGGADPSTLPWPEAKPPFVGGTVWVDGTGRAWVRRSLPAGEPALYDLFDGEGRLVGQVRFPPDRRLVGFGNGTLYAVHVDAMDLQTLEKYRLP
jgi:hypothetical protein